MQCLTYGMTKHERGFTALPQGAGTYTAAASALVYSQHSMEGVFLLGGGDYGGARAHLRRKSYLICQSFASYLSPLLSFYISLAYSDKRCLLVCVFGMGPMSDTLPFSSAAAKGLAVPEISPKDGLGAVGVSSGAYPRDDDILGVYIFSYQYTSLANEAIGVRARFSQLGDPPASKRKLGMDFATCCPAGSARQGGRHNIQRHLYIPYSLI